MTPLPYWLRAASTGDGVNTYDYDGTGERLSVQFKDPGATSVRTRVFAKDANGSVTGLEGTNGAVDGPSSYVYDPFGDLDETPTGPPNEDREENPFRFEGFYFDSGVKTYDMQARNYRPDAGRFLQEDVYESAAADMALGSDALTQSRYAFASGNPVTNVELDGHINGMGSGCSTTYCGDNQGGDMVASDDGGDKTGNRVTPTAGGTFGQRRIVNPATTGVVNSTAHTLLSGSVNAAIPHPEPQNDEGLVAKAAKGAKGVAEDAGRAVAQKGGQVIAGAARGAGDAAEFVTDVHVDRDQCAIPPGTYIPCYKLRLGDGTPRGTAVWAATSFLPETRVGRWLGKVPSAVRGAGAALRSRFAGRSAGRLGRVLGDARGFIGPVRPSSQQIATGHAFRKHVVQRGEFPEVATPDQFARQIEGVVSNPTASKPLARGRSAYYDEPSNTLVIRDPRSPDGGTAFRPTGGRDYYDGLR